MLNVFCSENWCSLKGGSVCGGGGEVELLEYQYQISKLMECTSKQLIMKMQTLFYQLQYPHLKW